MADAHKNFASSTVATAPSPAASGTSLVLASGGGALFPTPPFNVTIWPTAVQPSAANAEIARVTAVSTNTLTLVRAQEGSSARTVVVGDQVAATITTKTLTDVENGQGLNVKTYGALGDGSTDDTAAINAALTAAGAVNGNTLYFPPGQYVLTSPIVIPTRTIIRGAGSEAAVLNAASTFPHTTVNGAQTMGGATNWTLTVATNGANPFPSSGVIQVHGHSVTYTGKTASTFTGCNNNPPNTALTNGEAVGAFMVVLGDPGGGATFRQRIESMGIDCQSVAGSSGIYSNRINEQAGGHDLVIRGYMGIAIRVERALSPTSGTSQNWFFEKLHILGSASAPASVKAISLSNNSDQSRGIRDATLCFQGGVTVAGSIALLLDGVTATFEDFNIEGHTTGVEIAQNVPSLACGFQNICSGGGAGSMTDLFHIGGTQDYYGLNIRACRNATNIATNTIRNQDAAHLLTSTATTVSYYTVGRTYTITTDA